MDRTPVTPARILSAGLALLVSLTVFAPGQRVFAQSSVELNRSLELSREGRWAEAAELLARLLDDPATAPMARCEAYALGAYPLAQLGDTAAATDYVHRFDAECAAAPPGWPRREINKMRVALGLGPDPNAVEPPPMRPGPPPSARGDGWTTTDPVALGLDTLALAEHGRLCERSAADACLMVYRGRIVQELYGPDYREPMYAMSSTKSVTGLVAGLLIADGKLALDDPVADYIPEWGAGAEDGVTVRHLLTMTAGLDRRMDPQGPRQSVGFVVDDKNAFVFSLPLDAEPGARWAYSNEGVQLLSPLLSRAAGEPIQDYARRRLFEPLGMANTRLHVYPENVAWTYADLETTPRDLARIGQMMLQRGRWEDEEIVPETWVEVSVTPIPQNPAYGLLWWLDVPGGFAARGYLDTNLYVLPERDLVVVRMQSKPTWAPESYEPAALDLLQRLAPE